MDCRQTLDPRQILNLHQISIDLRRNPINPRDPLYPRNFQNYSTHVPTYQPDSLNYGRTQLTQFTTTLLLNVYYDYVVISEAYLEPSKTFMMELFA